MNEIINHSLINYEWLMVRASWFTARDHDLAMASWAKPDAQGAPKSLGPQIQPTGNGQAMAMDHELDPSTETVCRATNTVAGVVIGRLNRKMRKAIHSEKVK